MYEIGKGVGQSDATAAKWFRKAAEQGHAQAQGIERATPLIEITLQLLRYQQAAATTLPSPSPSPAIPIGARVELRGLQAKPELNGRRGVVVKVVGSSGRYRVQLDEGDEAFSLKAGSLFVVAVAVEVP